nr:MAG TPA: hypothetical protein [Caudoviricetes sp.]
MLAYLHQNHFQLLESLRWCYRCLHLWYKQISYSNCYLSEDRKTQKRRHRGKAGCRQKKKVVGVWNPTPI